MTLILMIVSFLLDVVTMQIGPVRTVLPLKLILHFSGETTSEL